MKAGLTISTVGHLTLLAWGLVTFSTKPFEAAPVESLPVDIISAAELSQLMAGAKTAPKAETPRPVVDKIGEPAPVKELAPKVSDKPEITTAAAETPPPLPESRPDKREKKEPEPKVDPIAETLKKEEAKTADPPKKQAETPTPPKRPLPPQPKFDANKIAALLDKRDPRRQAATGAALNRTAALGATTGTAATLSQNEIDALRAQIQACWNPPAGAAEADKLHAELRIKLNQDGTLAAEPVLLNRDSSQYFQIFAESTMRAVRRCQPYRLPISKYEVWRDIEVNFRLSDMLRG